MFEHCKTKFDLWKAYRKAEAPILEAYSKAYSEATAPLLEAYKEAEVTLWKAYNEAYDQAYREGIVPLLNAYEEQLSKIENDNGQ